MGAIMFCIVIIAMGLGLYVFDHTEAGKKYLT